MNEHFKKKKHFTFKVVHSLERSDVIYHNIYLKLVVTKEKKNSIYIFKRFTVFYAINKVNSKL